MKNCTGCKWASWDRTAAGRLHPSGEGYCMFPVKQIPPPLPASMHWFGAPWRVAGGLINRRQELPEHCKFFQREDARRP